MENGYSKPRNPNLKALKPDEITRVVRIRGRELDVHDFFHLSAEERGLWLKEVNDYLANHAPELTLNQWSGQVSNG